MGKGSQRFGGWGGTSDVHDLCTYCLLVRQSNELLADRVRGARNRKTSGVSMVSCSLNSYRDLASSYLPHSIHIIVVQDRAEVSGALVTTKKPVGSWQMSVSHSAMSSL